MNINVKCLKQVLDQLPDPRNIYGLEYRAYLPVRFQDLFIKDGEELAQEELPILTFRKVNYFSRLLEWELVI